MCLNVLRMSLNLNKCHGDKTYIMVDTVCQSILFIATEKTEVIEITLHYQEIHL